VLDRGGSPNEPPPGNPEVSGARPTHRPLSLDYAPPKAISSATRRLAALSFDWTRTCRAGAAGGATEGIENLTSAIVVVTGEFRKSNAIDVACVLRLLNMLGSPNSLPYQQRVGERKRRIAAAAKQQQGWERASPLAEHERRSRRSSAVRRSEISKLGISSPEACLPVGQVKRDRAQRRCRCDTAGPAVTKVGHSEASFGEAPISGIKTRPSVATAEVCPVLVRQAPGVCQVLVHVGRGTGGKTGEPRKSPRVAVQRDRAKTNEKSLEIS
jgi:hypothetical protein